MSHWDFDQIAIPSYPHRLNWNTIFWHESEEEKWKIGCKRFGESWFYYDKSVVTYNFNKLGYRSKNIEDLSADEFFIVYGCSHSEATGLTVEQSWHYQFSNMVGLEYLNFGHMGAGPDFVMNCSSAFIKNSPRMPKFVLIQWPHTHRMVFRRNQYLDFLGPWIDDDRLDFYGYWTSDGNDTNYSMTAYHQTKLLWDLAKIPVIHFTIELQNNIEDTVVHRLKPTAKEMKAENLARDIHHFGADYHQRIAKWLYNIFLNTKM